MQDRTGQPRPDAQVLDLLKAAYSDITSENQRLRDARASLTRQLGPLPISAALIAGLVAAFPGPGSRDPAQWVLIALALPVFLLMVLVSIRYSSMPPYRELRDEIERRGRTGLCPKPLPETPAGMVLLVIEGDLSNEERWYGERIELERHVREQRPQSQPLPKSTEEQTVDAEGPESGDPSELASASPEMTWLHRARLRLAELLWPPRATNLIEGHDLERRGLFLVQGLFALIVVLLIGARVL